MQLSLSNWNYVKFYQKAGSLQLYNYLRQYSGYQHVINLGRPVQTAPSYTIDEIAKSQLFIIRDYSQDSNIFAFITSSYLQYIQELDMFYNYSKEFLADNLKMPDFIEQKLKRPSHSYILPENREVLVNHDMMGGYVEDNSIEVKTPKKGFYYRMLHFMSCSMFNYFSHHFITIPPLAYIKIAHDLSSKVLGTIIVEHADLYGPLVAELTLEETPILNKLINILKDKGFDGYLLKFESRYFN